MFKSKKAKDAARRMAALTLAFLMVFQYTASGLSIYAWAEDNRELNAVEEQQEEEQAEDKKEEEPGTKEAEPEKQGKQPEEKKEDTSQPQQEAEKPEKQETQPEQKAEKPEKQEEPETQPEEQKKEEEEDDEVEYPAQDFTEVVSGVTVRIHATENALPEGSAVVIKAVKAASVEKTIEQTTGDDVKVVKAMDITFKNKEGEEIEPEEKVSVNFEYEKFGTIRSPVVYHITDEGQAEKLDTSAVGTYDDQVSINVQDFSIYAVGDDEQEPAKAKAPAKAAADDQNEGDGETEEEPAAETWTVTFYDRDVGETKYEGGEEVTSDLEITAKFINKYKVDFVIEGEGGTEERLSQYFRTEGDTIGTMPQDPFVAGKVFEKWVKQGTDEEVTAETEVNGNITAVAVFREVTVYNITAEYYYLNDAGNEVIFNTDLLQVENHELPYTITAPSTTQTSPDEVSGAPIYYPETPTVEVKKSDFVSDKKTTVRIKYVPYTAEYDFVYLLKDLDGDGYTEIEREENVHGVLNSYVTPTVKTYDYAVLARAEGATITQAKGQELPVYYTRKNFQLTYDTKGGSYVGGTTAPYGTVVDLPTTNPTRTGYDFAGWYMDEDLTQRVTGSVTLNNNITLYAKWNPKTVNYTIMYMKEVYDNSTGTTSYVYENSRTAQGAVDSTVFAANAPNVSGTLNGYERDAAKNGTSTAGGTGEDTAVIVKADGSTVLKVYYSLIRYTLVFH